MNKINNSLLLTISVIVIVILVSIPTLVVVYKNEYKVVSYTEMTQLKYSSTKYELSVEIDKYINSVAPNSSLQGIAIVEECMNYNIDPIFVLAQGHIESHFGTKGMARKTNSVFNVYAFDNYSYRNINKKGKYNDPNHSIKPYMELLSKKYLVGKTEYDLMIEYVDINGNRYASDGNYENKLTSKYDSITKTTRIDSLYGELRKYSIILSR